MNDVPRNQLSRGNRLPLAVTLDPREDRQTLAEQRERSMSATLLHSAHGSVKEQQGCDDACLNEFAQHEFEHNGQLEHPWHRRPELAEDSQPGMPAFLGDHVRPVLSEASRGFLGTEACCCLDARQLIVDTTLRDSHRQRWFRFRIRVVTHMLPPTL